MRLKIITFLAAGVAAYALVLAAIGYVPDALRPSYAQRALLFRVHMAAGAVALTIGALQFGPFAPERRRRWHRLLGRTYAAAVLASGLAALGLAPYSDEGVVTHFGFGTLAVLWLFTTGIAVAAIRAGSQERHRRFMVRSYALTLAAVTLRLEIPLLMIATQGNWHVTYLTVSWLCWVPNLIAAELWLRTHGAHATGAGLTAEAARR